MTIIEFTSTIGLVSVLGACIYIGRKLQVLDNLDNSVGKIKTNMSVVCTYLARHHETFDPKELHTLSPFQLTDEGKELIVSLGFDHVFRNNKADFFNFIDSEEVKLKYDVEAAAIKSIYGLYDKTYMDFLKVYFYNNPTRNLANIAPTFGVYVRDMYLSEHPEITQ